MARIVLGAGTSHTPMLTMGSEHWVHRAASDYRNPLNQSDGAWISYEELLEQTGGRYADQVTPTALDRLSETCQRALDRLKAEITVARLDVLIVVGDDQTELFGPENMPAVSLYCGEHVVTYNRWGGDDSVPAWAQISGRGYAMERSYSFPGARDFALELVGGMMDREIDLAISSQVADPDKAGFGHAFGFVIRRLLDDTSLPTIPLLINTYYPPNVLTAARCHAIGRALRESVEASGSDLRVGVIASGGLSHFIVDEELDRRVIAGFDPDQAELLHSLPKGTLMSGSSEILNWVVAAGAVDHLPMRWLEYYPVYRTPAGTGVGTAFAVWAPAEEAH